MAEVNDDDCKNKSKSVKQNVGVNPNDVLFAALTIAVAVTAGRSRYEVETLINLSSLITNNLQAVLAQMIINEKGIDVLDAKI